MGRHTTQYCKLINDRRQASVVPFQDQSELKLWHLIHILGLQQLWSSNGEHLTNYTTNGTMGAAPYQHGRPLTHSVLTLSS